MLQLQVLFVILRKLRPMRMAGHLQFGNLPMQKKTSPIFARFIDRSIIGVSAMRLRPPGEKNLHPYSVSNCTSSRARCCLAQTPRLEGIDGNAFLRRVLGDAALDAVGSCTDIRSSTAESASRV